MATKARRRRGPPVPANCPTCPNPMYRPRLLKEESDLGYVCTSCFHFDARLAANGLPKEERIARRIEKGWRGFRIYISQHTGNCPLCDFAAADKRTRWITDLDILVCRLCYRDDYRYIAEGLTRDQRLHRHAKRRLKHYARVTSLRLGQKISYLTRCAICPRLFEKGLLIRHFEHIGKVCPVCWGYEWKLRRRRVRREQRLRLLNMRRVVLLLDDGPIDAHEVGEALAKRGWKIVIERSQDLLRPRGMPIRASAADDEEAYRGQRAGVWIPPANAVVATWCDDTALFLQRLTRTALHPPIFLLTGDVRRLWREQFGKPFVGDNRRIWDNRDGDHPFRDVETLSQKLVSTLGWTGC